MEDRVKAHGAQHRGGKAGSQVRLNTMVVKVGKCNTINNIKANSSKDMKNITVSMEMELFMADTESITDSTSN